MGTLEKTFTPGPTMLSSPPFGLAARHENAARCRLLLTAPTAITDGQLAGLPTGNSCGSCPEFPEAATTRQLLLRAANAACSYAGEKVDPTCTGLPRDSEITVALFWIAQLIPASIHP